MRSEYFTFVSWRARKINCAPMLIKILGTRGEIKLYHPKYFRYSGILIDNRILLDIGEPEFLKYAPELIFITHLHPDHAYFIRSQEIEATRINSRIYAPEQPGKLKQIKILTKPLRAGSYQITPIPVIHSLAVKSQGYIVQKGKKRIFYSGDIVAIEEQYYSQLRNLDLIITEGSFIRKGGVVRKNEDGEKFGHAGIPYLVELFSQFTRHIIFMHFGSWFMKDVEKAKKKILSLASKSVQLDIAYDNKEYSI